MSGTITSSRASVHPTPFGRSVQQLPKPGNDGGTDCRSVPVTASDQASQPGSS
ncbi:hypothetical protein [Subtercola frigoramans]|uniref:Uncharacterized protein n=1 Tax=Subtercola frigoramans TaxID=120298 RepID=A0ABS2L806_9MICO|nr:hypothetical protein [Subtercola frigoramans]MBM7473119.1 hypothetical protein [Subtercola frigoramans]